MLLSVCGCVCTQTPLVEQLNHRENESGDKKSHWADLQSYHMFCQMSI